MAIKVKLRQKRISNNRQSLYLDFYPAMIDPKTGVLTRREFLNMFLYNEIEIEEQKYIDANGKEQKRFVTVLDKKGKPKKIKLGPLDKQHNNDTLQLAEQIRQKWENQVNKPEIYTGFEKEQLRLKELRERSFIEYFKQLADKRKTSNHDNWLSAYFYLNTFTNGELKFADLNERFCEDFKEYLLNVKSSKSTEKKLSQNTCVSYFNKLKAALKQAYKDGYLQVSLNEKIEPIKSVDVDKNTLTIDELNTLAKTDCPNDTLKKAVFFSALAGVPFKEMQNLKWHNIIVSEDNGITINTTRQKTGKPYNVNIGEQAYKLIGEPQQPTDKVFPGLNDNDRYELFQLWLARAGITKKLTFHDLRHTYGTLQIDAGTDIYVLKGNMAHSNVRFTQQYAHQSDRRKREAVESVKLDL